MARGCLGPPQEAVCNGSPRGALPLPVSLVGSGHNVWNRNACRKRRRPCKNVRKNLVEEIYGIEVLQSASEECILTDRRSAACGGAGSGDGLSPRRKPGMCTLYSARFTPTVFLRGGVTWSDTGLEPSLKLWRACGQTVGRGRHALHSRAVKQWRAVLDPSGEYRGAVLFNQARRPTAGAPAADAGRHGASS